MSKTRITRSAIIDPEVLPLLPDGVSFIRLMNTSIGEFPHAEFAVTCLAGISLGVKGVDNEGILVCSRARGHAGNHVAHGAPGMPLCAWVDEDPLPAARLEEAIPLSTFVVDPDNENIAALPDGKIGFAVRLGPVGAPAPVTLEEWKEMPIVGYIRPIDPNEPGIAPPPPYDP